MSNACQNLIKNDLSQSHSMVGVVLLLTLNLKSWKIVAPKRGEIEYDKSDFSDCSETFYESFKVYSN